MHIDTYVYIHNQSLPLGGLDVLEIIFFGEVHSKVNPQEVL